jgi:RNA polymerase sigma factor (sigma-70 family)
LAIDCGVPAQDAQDVAQTVWLHVHRRRASYHAPTHKTPRAWITGFVVRCAANHRRKARRPAAALVDELIAAMGLDPEQSAIVAELHRALPNEEQRLALVLQLRHGLTIAEIAAVQEVTESAVEWRLQMARKHLKDGDGGNRRGAYLGFGSLEALGKALQPTPIPDEVGRRQWERIAERIRQEEASPHDTDPPSGSSEPPPSLPPAAALPAISSPAAPALITLGAAKLGGFLLFTFLSGAASGVGCVLAWRAHETTRHDRAPPPLQPEPAPSTPAAPSSTPAAPLSSACPAAPGSAALAAPPVSVSSAQATATEASGAATLSERQSRRVLMRMRDAMTLRQFSMVLALADQHARQCGATHLREREALRIEALRQTGRTKDAEQQARAVVATHPEHRAVMERAAGQPLP